jgi:hypothetical protein
MSGRHEIKNSTLSSRRLFYFKKNFLVPGPGAYRSFSEWGVYESKNANQASSSTAPNEM